MIKDYLSSIIFASRCPSCGIGVFAQHTLCHECWSKIVFITGDSCRSCGRPMKLESEYPQYCNNICFRRKKIFKSIKIGCLYTGPMKKIIHRFKYEDKTMYIEVISKLLQYALDHIDHIDAIIPVPLHSSRLKERGYNQSAIIAKHVAAILKRPCYFDLLVRCRKTEKQMSLSRSMRLKNVKDAFMVRTSEINALKKLNVLLVDDIMTTGVTMRECAKILKNAGALSVSAVAVART